MQFSEILTQQLICPHVLGLLPSKDISKIKRHRRKKLIRELAEDASSQKDEIINQMRFLLRESSVSVRTY